MVVEQYCTIRRCRSFVALHVTTANHLMHNFDAAKLFSSFTTEEFTHYLWKVFRTLEEQRKRKVTLLTGIIYCA